MGCIRSNASIEFRRSRALRNHGRLGTRNHKAHVRGDGTNHQHRRRNGLDGCDRDVFPNGRWKRPDTFKFVVRSHLGSRFTARSVKNFGPLFPRRYGMLLTSLSLTCMGTFFVKFPPLRACTGKVLAKLPVHYGNATSLMARPRSLFCLMVPTTSRDTSPYFLKTNSV